MSTTSAPRPPPTSSPGAVGELMSSPVVTALAGAAAGVRRRRHGARRRRLRRRGRRPRPARRHPHRARPRPGLGRRRRRPPRHRGGVDDRGARHRGARPCRSTSALDTLARRGYRHIPVVDDDALVGIVSMRDLMKVASIRPAGEAAIDVPRGLKGVVVTETAIGDVRGDRGLLPLPPVLGRRPGRAAHPRGRLGAAVRRRAARRGRPRGLRRRGRARSERCRRRSTRCCARSPRGPAATGRSTGCAPCCRRSPPPRASAVLRPRRPGAPPRRPAPRRGDAHDRRRPPPAAARASNRSRPAPTSATPPTTSGWSTATEPTPDGRPGHRAVPDAHRRPRLQRLDLHRPGDRLHRRRPRRRGRRRASARCPARSTAARPAGRSPCSTPSARPDRAPAYIRERGRARRADHGLRPRRLQDRRPPLDAAARRRPSASAAPGSTSPSRSSG